MWNAMALRISRAASSLVALVATQPGKSAGDDQPRRARGFHQVFAALCEVGGEAAQLRQGLATTASDPIRRNFHKNLQSSRTSE